MNLLSVIVATAILIVGILVFGMRSASTTRQVVQLREKLWAEMQIADLLELFRGLTSTQLYEALKVNPATASPPGYPLCAHLNLLDRATGTVLNPHPIADLVPGFLGDAMEVQTQANRFFQVQVVDADVSLAPLANYCNRSPDAIALSGNQLLVTVGMSWRSPAKTNQDYQRVVLSTLLPP